MRTRLKPGPEARTGSKAGAGQEASYQKGVLRPLEPFEGIEERRRVKLTTTPPALVPVRSKAARSSR